MKINNTQYSHFGKGIITIMVLIFVFAPTSDFAAKMNTHSDRIELRIIDLHIKLKITPAEDAQWAKVADAMRADAKTMDKLTLDRAEHAKNMTAVDDLKSYGEIVQAHADGIKRLTPLFASLYAEMPDKQKALADAVFRHGKRKPVPKPVPKSSKSG